MNHQRTTRPAPSPVSTYLPGSSRLPDAGPPNRRMRRPIRTPIHATLLDSLLKTFSGLFEFIVLHSYAQTKANLYKMFSETAKV